MVQKLNTHELQRKFFLVRRMHNNAHNYPNTGKLYSSRQVLLEFYVKIDNCDFIRYLVFKIREVNIFFYICFILTNINSNKEVLAESENTNCTKFYFPIFSYTYFA